MKIAPLFAAAAVAGFLLVAANPCGATLARIPAFQDPSTGAFYFYDDVTGYYFSPSNGYYYDASANVFYASGTSRGAIPEQPQAIASPITAAPEPYATQGNPSAFSPAPQIVYPAVPQIYAVPNTVYVPVPYAQRQSRGGNEGNHPEAWHHAEAARRRALAEQQRAAEAKQEAERQAWNELRRTHNGANTPYAHFQRQQNERIQEQALRQQVQQGHANLPFQPGQTQNQSCSARGMTNSDPRCRH